MAVVCKDNRHFAIVNYQLSIVNSEFSAFYLRSRPFPV
jgi:hypothetical protein